MMSLIDQYSRNINYLRISVTDRCDLRCVYCMKERMEFIPKKEILTLEEFERLCDNFIELGVKKIRLTGGEPLVRRDVIKLIKRLNSKKNKTNLQEITLTTNGTLLEKYAFDLKAAGVDRINVSLDTINQKKYKEITRFGDLNKVILGIKEAKKNNIAIKINTVVLKNFNEGELVKLVYWTNKIGADITFIEVMPMAETDTKRYLQFSPLNNIYDKLDKNFSFILEAEVSGYESKPSGQRELVKSIATKEVRIASRAELESQLLYSSGPFSNSGSLPPEVGKATTYTVVWSLSNYYNDISDVVVRASLPSYIKWIGAVSPSSENVSHYSSTNEVVWRIETVDSATGVINPKKEMAFQVSFVPSTSQIGDVAEIAGRASFEAEDDFTGFILRDLSGVLYTNSINEAKVDSAKGLIVE